MHIGDKPTRCIQTRKLCCDAEPFAVVIKQMCKKKKERETAAVSEQYKGALAVVISAELSITHYSRSGQKTGKLSLPTQQRTGT